jgi:sodium/hydrogen exchanger 8
MFFSNILPILGLAMFGGFFSTFVISLLMYLFSRLLTDNGWSFIESLVFGSLISSTDPVTVLSLLPESVDKRLYMFIFGESALNDAVAIILYRFFVGLQKDANHLSALPFFMSILASIGVFIGSFFVGVVPALVYAKITKHVWISGYEGAIYEMIMLVVCAYSSYLMAEVFSLTGIISIFFCGIAMAHYATPNMTDLTKKTVKVRLL